jgi:hypothetical protein
LIDLFTAVLLGEYPQKSGFNKRLCEKRKSSAQMFTAFFFNDTLGGCADMSEAVAYVNWSRWWPVRPAGLMSQ